MDAVIHDDQGQSLECSDVNIPRVASCDDLDRMLPPVYCIQDNRVIYTCGGCGQWTHFAEGKTVDADGNVTPSMRCRRCGWHVFGRLMDWTVTQ